MQLEDFILKDKENEGKVVKLGKREDRGLRKGVENREKRNKRVLR